MLYRLLRPLLFSLDAEKTHELTIKLLASSWFVRLANKFSKSAFSSPCDVMGLRFGNPLGMAAGFDKNAECFSALFALGFAFVEVGTVVPKPQTGNAKPRLFRLTQHHALINHLGFNSKGVDFVVNKLKERVKNTGVLGVNIGKNLTTPIEHAIDDYAHCLTKVYPYADYITANISSPNTPKLRDLYQQEFLDGFVGSLVSSRNELQKKHQRYVPLVFKISTDISTASLYDMLDVFLKHHVDGVCTTNTFAHRRGVEDHPLAIKQGGLSGRPITKEALRTTVLIKKYVGDRLPIIGVGGIETAQDARQRLAAGASLMQIYSGLVFQGPGLIRDILRSLP